MTVNTDAPLELEGDGEPIDMTVTATWMPLPALLPAQDVWMLAIEDGRWSVVPKEQRVLSYAARVESWSTRLTRCQRGEVREAAAAMRECCSEPGVTAVLLASGVWGLLGSTAFLSREDAEAQAAQYNAEASAS